VQSEAEALSLTDDQAAAPARVIDTGPRRNAALLGEIACLMLRFPDRRQWPIARLCLMLAPAIASRQFRCYSDEAGAPIGFLSWALLSAEAERRYIREATLRPEDWTSGDAAYLVDYVALPGATRMIVRHLRRQPPFAGPFRAVRTRNGENRLIEISLGHGGRARLKSPAASPG
jgi:hemolysin-activating ACP:hemolysin acyltransferase